MLFDKILWECLGYGLFQKRVQFHVLFPIKLMLAVGKPPNANFKISEWELPDS